MEYNFSDVIALWVLHMFPNCIATLLVWYVYWAIHDGVCSIVLDNKYKKVCSMSSHVTYKVHTYNTFLNYRQFVLLLICRKPTCGVIGCRFVCYLSCEYMELINMNSNQINLAYHHVCSPPSPNYHITVVSQERSSQHNQYWLTSWTLMRKWRSCVVTIAMVKIRYL